MANNLGSLVVSLGLDAAEFTRGMSKGEYQAKQSTDRVKSMFADLGKYVAGLGLGAGFVTLVKNTADAAVQIDRLAKLSNTSAESFQTAAFAAERYGVSQEKLADIFKDVQDKVGDFLQTGAGPLADFFEKIAPKVGVTAEEFRKLSGPEALQLYVSSLEKANLSQSEMTFFMEAIASDSALLTPLLKGNGEEMKRLGDEAQRLGAIMSTEAVNAAKEFGDNLTRLNAAGSALAANIGNAVIPSLNNLINEFNAGISAAGGFWSALSLGTINPFRSSTGNIKVLRDELKGLQGDRERYVRAGSDTRGIDDAIKTTETKLNYLAVLERQAQLSDNRRLGAEFGRDDPKLNSLRTRNSLYLPPVATPGKPPKTGSSRPAASSGKDPILEANEREAGMLKLLADLREDEIRVSRQFNIDELESIERRNTEYQKLVQTLIDDTPTQKLEQQRQTMQLLADEYERGRFGAAGSADAIRLYSETVGTYLGTLGEGVKEINATADQSGQIFGSWLETAITDGAKLSDVINGLIRDLVQLAIRKAVIEPAVGAFTGFVSSALGSYSGGGYTGMGARSGGLDGQGGFMAMLHPNETVIDHSKGQGMGGVTVVQNVSIDARGADAGVEARIQSAMRQAKAEAVAEVAARASRGGSYASAVGRA
jgi:hypothetical protein